MRKTLGYIVDLKAALWVNAFFYYVKRLWLVGKRVPETVYARYGLKKGLSVAAAVLRQVSGFFGKPVYLFCVVLLPLLALGDGAPGQGVAFLTQVLFFLSCITGAFGDSRIFAVTRDKITCIKYLHMDARTYLRADLVYQYVPFFVYYLVWLPVFARLLGGTVMQGLALWLLLFCFRMLSEALQLWVFDRKGKVLSRNMAFDWLVIAVGCAGAYVPAVLGWELPLSAILLHPAASLLCAAVGGSCLWYIAAGYRHYAEKLHRSVDLNFLLSSILKTSTGASAACKEIEIREEAVSSRERDRFADRKGYAYLNALFFARHRRQLVRPVYYRLASAAALFAAGCVLLAADRTAAAATARNLTAMLPFFVYIMYFMTVADKASRAMFYNCDKNLLRYAYYRQPGTILQNFKIRLARVALYDLAIAGAVCLAAAGFRLLCGVGLWSADLLLFCLAILLLSVLFTVHHLCLYYIFQPYSENLQVKNPFYSCINMGMYVVCFLCLRIEAGGLAFTSAVLVCTVAYIAAALVLVYCRAPRTFRVK